MAILILMPDLDHSTLVKQLRHFDPQLDIRIWPDQIGDHQDIEFIICWKHPHGEFHHYPNLKVICSFGAGVDHIIDDPQLPDNINLCRTADDQLAQRMAEYVSWSIANHLRRLDEYPKLQTKRIWKRIYPVEKQITVGILGLGVLGQRCAQVLHLTGYRIIGWSRQIKILPNIESTTGSTGLANLLKQSEILVCLLPLTKQTENILDYSLFKQLPQGAYVINAARGKHLVDKDLLKVLDEEHLAGACLDVFRQEPLPTNDPLWQHPKVLLTPHISSLTNPLTAAQQIYDNYHLFKKGQPLLNQVDPKAGY